MKFEVEHEGKKFELEAPSMEEGIKALQPYIGGGMQQAAQPGVGTNTEMGSEGRWAPNPLVMAGNLPGDIAEVGGNMAQAVMHPIDTAKGVYDMGWDGFKDMIYSQYGTWDNFVNYMEKHPASFAMDASMVGGPAAAGIKATGMAGKAGMLGKAASMGAKVAEGAAALDPFSAAIKVGSKLGTGVGKVASTGLGLTTGTDEAVALSAKAGYEGALSSDLAGKALDKAGLGAAKGSDAGKAWMSQHKGVDEATSVVDRAREVMSEEKFRQRVAHDKRKAPILADPTQLDIAPIQKAITDIAKGHEIKPTGTSTVIKSPNDPGPYMKQVLETIEYFRAGGKKPSDLGKIAVKAAIPAAPAVKNKAGKVVTPAVRAKKAVTRDATWADLPDAPDTWKMNSFDMMRSKIGEIMGKIPTTEPGAKGEIGRVYGAITEEIDKTYLKAAHAAGNPKVESYAKILGESRKAQQELKEIIQTFSLKEGTAKDTSLRKLHSAVRPSLSAGNFGGRSAIAQALVDAGHENLMFELAGAHTRPMMKNSIGTWVTGGVGSSGMLAGTISPYFVATLVAFSPKLIGRAAYEFGRVAGSIIKPAVAIERALRRKLRRAGVSTAMQKRATKGAQYGAAQAGRLAEAGENKEELKASLIEEAQKRGFNIHGRVLNSLADKIMSDDPDSYLQGVRAVGKNPRLLKLFMDIGTKGEQ